MSPSRLERLSVRAASWMFMRQVSADFWWTPAVLTIQNQDHPQPVFSLEDAEEVFTELTRRKLLVPAVVSNQGPVAFLAHRINGNLKAEWTKFVEKEGFIDLTLLPWIQFYFGGDYMKLVALVVAFLSAVFLAFCTKLAANLADRVWIPPTEVKLIEKPPSQ